MRQVPEARQGLHLLPHAQVRRLHARGPVRQRRPVRGGQGHQEQGGHARPARLPGLGRRPGDLGQARRLHRPQRQGAGRRLPGRERPQGGRPVAQEGRRPRRLRPRRLDRRRDPGEVPAGARPVHPRPGRRQVHRHHDQGRHPGLGRLGHGVAAHHHRRSDAAGDGPAAGGLVGGAAPGAEPRRAVRAVRARGPAAGRVRRLLPVAGAGHGAQQLLPLGAAAPLVARGAGPLAVRRAGQLHHHPDRPQLLERRAQHGHLAGRLPAAGGRVLAAGVHPDLAHDPRRDRVPHRVHPAHDDLAGRRRVIWSFVYNADPQIGVLNAVLDRLGILGVDWRLGPLELHPGAWLSNPGVLHLGFADIRLTNLVLVVPAFWAFTGFGVITLTAGLTAVPYELVEAAKVDGANAWQTARRILVPALRRPLIVVGVVSVIFALRTFDIVYVMTGGGPAQDTMVLALLLWQQAFAFLDTPQGGQATAIAVLMSAVLVAGSWSYLRQLLAGRSR